MVPYEMPPQGGLIVPSSGLGCFKLKFPSRCWIVKIVVTQTDGPAADFTAALFNKENVCSGQEGSDSDRFTEPSIGILPDDVYRVTNDLSGTAGKLVYFTEQTGGYGYVFCSQDTDKNVFHGARIGQNREIYLRIVAPPGVSRTYAIGMACIIWQ